MLTLMTLAAMIFLNADGTLGYGGEYTNATCGDALLVSDRDAICVSQESLLAPASSPRPRANPRRGN